MTDRTATIAALMILLLCLAATARCTPPTEPLFPDCYCAGDECWLWDGEDTWEHSTFCVPRARDMRKRES